MRADTVENLLTEGERTLARTIGGGARLDAQLLLSWVLALTRAQLLADAQAPATEAQTASYRRLLARRAAGEPIAYLTGRREFWSLELAVTPDVLIPRPETEILVERALTLGSAAARVADLGTGSGAIALAMARERPAWRVVATDISAPALAVARANAAALGLARVEFLEGSWFEPLRSERFELIVSNPPYIAAADPALEALRFEPPLALSSGPDGLAALQLLARGAGAHLAPGGWLLLEHGATQGEALRRELVAAGFTHVGSHRDLAGHERMTEGQR